MDYPCDVLIFLSQTKIGRFFDGVKSTPALSKYRLSYNTFWVHLADKKFYYFSKAVDISLAWCQNPGVVLERANSPLCAVRAVSGNCELINTIANNGPWEMWE